jgi:ribosome-binding protein aMBF1 (putative translation factor)
MKTKLINWRELDKKWMKDPKFIRAWQKVEPEYKLARALIGARLKKKMTQAQLAKKIGSKQPVISRIEAMTELPNISLLKRLAQALDSRLEIRFLAK